MENERFVPSAELQKFKEAHGEDAFIHLNLIYIAQQLEEIYDVNDNENGQFDSLCEDILEMYLDDMFGDYSVIDLADGVMFIMSDSNYTIKEYVRTYAHNREKITEELLAYLQKARPRK